MPQKEAMGTLAESIIEFIKERQLNIAVAGLFTVVYFMYQYWDVLFKGIPEEPVEHRRSRHLSRSKSRSRSRSRHRSPSYYEYKPPDSKHRRGRKIKRCADCSKCNNSDQ